MKKPLNEILATITPNTPLDKVLAYCDDVKDLEQILLLVPKGEKKPPLLPEVMKKSALRLLTTSKRNTEEINTAYLQKHLRVTYPQAAALLKYLNPLLRVQQLQFGQAKVRNA